MESNEFHTTHCYKCDKITRFNTYDTNILLTDNIDYHTKYSIGSIVL